MFYSLKKEIKKNYSKMITTSILTNILLIAFGLFLLVRPDTTLKIISYIIGTGILILGAFSFVKYLQSKIKNVNLNLIYSVICIIIGLSLIINPTSLATIIPFILGFWIIINGIIKIQYSFELKKYNNNSWIVSMIIAILILIWGLVFVFDPFGGALAITQIIGIFIIIYSILDILDVIIIHKNIKAFTNNKKIKNKKIIYEEK